MLKIVDSSRNIWYNIIDIKFLCGGKNNVFSQKLLEKDR